MKLRVDEILLGGRAAKSGLITSNARFTFRSRSARLFFLIQLSEEMWDFADDGELYFEKVLGFLKILLTEWQKAKVTHALSIIFLLLRGWEREWMGPRVPNIASSLSSFARCSDSGRSCCCAAWCALLPAAFPLLPFCCCCFCCCCCFFLCHSSSTSNIVLERWDQWDFPRIDSPPLPRVVSRIITWLLLTVKCTAIFAIGTTLWNYSNANSIDIICTSNGNMRTRSLD